MTVGDSDVRFRGAKRKCADHPVMSAFDPKRTEALPGDTLTGLHGRRLGRASMKRRFFIAALVGTTLWSLVALIDLKNLLPLV